MLLVPLETDVGTLSSRVSCLFSLAVFVSVSRSLIGWPVSGVKCSVSVSPSLIGWPISEVRGLVSVSAVSGTAASKLFVVTHRVLRSCWVVWCLWPGIMRGILSLGILVCSWWLDRTGGLVVWGCGLPDCHAARLLWHCVAPCRPVSGPAVLSGVLWLCYFSWLLLLLSHGNTLQVVGVVAVCGVSVPL